MNSKLILTLLLLSTLLLLRCSPARLPEKSQAPSLLLQPLGNFPPAETDTLKTYLDKIFDEVTILPALDFPKMAWYAPRSRYRADSLLKYFHPGVPKGYTKLMLSANDISVTKGQYPDFGIMGLALISGNVGIISTFRLHKDKKIAELKKLALHELGHTAGLSHCPESSCILHDAEGKNRFDIEDGLCESCTAKLRSVGWGI